MNASDFATNTLSASLLPSRDVVSLRSPPRFQCNRPSRRRRRSSGVSGASGARYGLMAETRGPVGTVWELEAQVSADGQAAKWRAAQNRDDQAEQDSEGRCRPG